VSDSPDQIPRLDIKVWIAARGWVNATEGDSRLVHFAFVIADEFGSILTLAGWLRRWIDVRSGEAFAGSGTS